MQWESMLYTASVWVLPVVIAITLHEAAHGFVAHRLGDDTAYRLGRVTFNPLKHIDLFGTILMPALLLLVRSPVVFGYAKPVPVDFHALRNPRRDMVLVALAGPGINIALATVAALLFHLVAYLPAEVATWVAQNLRNALLINVSWRSSICCRSRLWMAAGLPWACFPTSWRCPWPGSNPTA